jgi:hypothetical protein
MRATEGGRRGADDVYDFGSAALQADEGGGGGVVGFLSVDMDGDGTMDLGESRSILERLAERAAAAMEARKPKVKTREIKARFGGLRGAIAEGAAAGSEQGGGGFDAVEAEFLRELEDNVPQSFLPPHDANEDDDPAEEGSAPPFFFTEDVWEDIDYYQRKQSIVQQLADASDRIAQVSVALPDLKVDNDRLHLTCRKLEREAQDLQDQEKKILMRNPDFKKKFGVADKEQGEEEEVLAQHKVLGAVNAEEAREHKRQTERLRRRMKKRQSIILTGLHEVEENERDKGELYVSHSKTALHSFYMMLIVWAIKVEGVVSVLDPYRYSFKAIRTKMPRAVAYFGMLRRVNYVNLIFVLVAVPQIMQWIEGAVQARCSESTDGLIMPCVMRYSSLQRYVVQGQSAAAEPGGVDMSMLHIYLFVCAYVLVYGLTMRNLFNDIYAHIRGEIFQVDSNPYKFSQVVFNSWHCGIIDKRQHRVIGNQVISELKLLHATLTEEGAGEHGSEDVDAHLDDEMNEEETIDYRVVRYGGGLLVALVMMGTWILLEVQQPATLAYYPVGWQRIIAPTVCAVLNQWIAPTIIRFYVVAAKFRRDSHASYMLITTFMARFFNFAVILRSQFLLLSDSSRVLKLGMVRDTCFCEDEVGANLVYFWLTNWAASLVKVLMVPILHRAYAQITQTHRIRLGGKWMSVWRPSFEIAVWLVDLVFDQLFYLCSIPLFPAAPLLGVGTGIITFTLQRWGILNLWEPPKKVIYAPRRVRLYLSLCQLVSLHVATLVYFYFWVYGSTEKWKAPVCKLPLMFSNATSGALCTFDPTTGKEVGGTKCADYVTQACRGQSASFTQMSMYASASPAALVTERLLSVVKVVGAPIIAWVVASLLLLRYIVQHNYRLRFNEYVDEQRFRLLMNLSTLERTLTKQEKLLAIQSQY